MSYQCGIGLGMRRLGFEPCEPHIFCDGCGVKRDVTSTRRMGMPSAWFLNGKPAPGWKGGRRGNGRVDYCPRCKEPAPPLTARGTR